MICEPPSVVNCDAMSVLEGDSSQFGDDGQPVWLLPACLGMGGAESGEDTQQYAHFLSILCLMPTQVEKRQRNTNNALTPHYPQTPTGTGSIDSSGPAAPLCDG
jgi:hypothetical protein